jgi:hypothetical protein
MYNAEFVRKSMPSFICLAPMVHLVIATKLKAKYSSHAATILWFYTPQNKYTTVAPSSKFPDCVAPISRILVIHAAIADCRKL